MTIGLIQSASRGTNFYRLYQPLHHLKVLSWNIAETPSDMYAELTGLSAIFVSMPHTKSHLTVIKAAKVMGIPVIVDVDDLITVDEHGDWAYTFHMQSMSEADYLICATDYLAQMYGGLYVPSFLDLNLYPREKRDRLTILVRGSAAKRADYDSHMELFYTLEEKLNHPEWIFIGAENQHFMPKHKMCEDFLSPLGYFNKLCTISPHFIFHPLQDTPANRARSFNVYLETALCGAQLITNATWWKKFELKNVIYDINDIKLPPVPADPMRHMQYFAMDSYSEIFKSFR